MGGGGRLRSLDTVASTFLKVWWRDVTLFVYLLYQTYRNRFISSIHLSHSLRPAPDFLIGSRSAEGSPLAFRSGIWTGACRTTGQQTVRRTLSELRRILSELRRTQVRATLHSIRATPHPNLSYAHPILSTPQPIWATQYPIWATPHPNLSYAARCLRYIASNLSYAATKAELRTPKSELRCTLSELHSNQTETNISTVHSIK
jgi:hypothetical protein